MGEYKSRGIQKVNARIARGDQHRLARTAKEREQQRKEGTCTARVSIGPCGKRTPDPKISHCKEHGGEAIAERIKIVWPDDFE